MDIKVFKIRLLKLPEGVTVMEIETKKKRLIEIMEKVSFNYSDEPVFPLASGKMSKYYLDCKKTFSYSEARQLIGELIFSRFKDNDFSAAGGLSFGAYPVAIAVSDAAYRAGREIKAFVIRKEAKGHGLKRHIEGDINKEEVVLIVEDVVTSGGSTIDAIRKAREAGLTVNYVAAIVDREESGGRGNIEAEGVKFSSLLTLNDLVKYYKEKNG